MGRRTWHPRPAKRALAYVLAKYGPICWLCGHTIEKGAESVDHVQPAADYPQLEHDPDNWRPAHLHPAGQPKGCQTTGCRCPGNTGRRNKPWTTPPSRPW